MSDRRLPPPAPPRAKSAQEALEEARLAEAARKEAEIEARQKRDLAQKLAEEARARFLEEKARKDAEEQRLQAQRAAEEQRRRAEAARKEARRRQEEDREAEEQAARDRAMATGPVRQAATRSAPPAKTGPHEAPILEGRVRAILARLADDIEIVDLHSDIRPDVLAVLWQAHVKRARMEHDLPTLALALALATRFDQRAQAMVAARVLWGGQEWAVWLDTERKEVLAALTPADRYLTGL